MSAALPSRRLFALCSATAFVLVFVVFAVFDRRGLGLGHYYYLAVVLAALAGGARAGAASGILATGLFQLGVIVNPHLSATNLVAYGSVVRASIFVAMGVLVGFFADSHRRMVAELTVLADRDSLTGLPNTRAFEAAIGRRLAGGQEFTLLTAELMGSEDPEVIADEPLRSIADGLLLQLDPSDELARVGAHEFAILARQNRSRASSLALKLERAGASPAGGLCFGWATYPEDGDNALSLYRAANERLYARKIVAEHATRQRREAQTKAG
jgi:GGDEF domain-containing protein